MNAVGKSPAVPLAFSGRQSVVRAKHFCQCNSRQFSMPMLLTLFPCACVFADEAVRGIKAGLQVVPLMMGVLYVGFLVLGQAETEDPTAVCT